MRNTKQRRSREELVSLARAFEGSGETRQEYAAGHGIAVHTLDYYRRQSEGPSKPRPLIEVDWRSGVRWSGDRAELTIRLRNGRSLEGSVAVLAQMAVSGNLATLLSAADPE